jgi:hypothetical protein
LRWHRITKKGNRQSNCLSLLLNDWLLSDASIEKLLESRNHRLLPLAKILTWSTHVQSLMHGLHL